LYQKIALLLHFYAKNSSFARKDVFRGQKQERKNGTESFTGEGLLHPIFIPKIRLAMTVIIMGIFCWSSGSQ
jgi:hypothetical protein